MGMKPRKKPVQFFKKGDRVRWSSQAGGVEKTKEGEVVYVLGEGKNIGRSVPVEMFPHGTALYSARRHESYVVKVGSKFYWPLVKYLVKVS